VRGFEKTGALMVLEDRVKRACLAWKAAKLELTRESLEVMLAPFCRLSLYWLFKLYGRQVSETKVPVEILEALVVSVLTIIINQNPVVNNLNGSEVPEEFDGTLESNLKAVIAKSLKGTLAPLVRWSFLLIFHLLDNAPFVFHIDEVQGWSVPADITARKMDDLVPSSDWQKYTYIVLTRMLNELVTLVPQFRVVLSGRDYIVGRCLQYASGVLCSSFLFVLMPYRAIPKKFFFLESYDYQSYPSDASFGSPTYLQRIL